MTTLNADYNAVLKSWASQGHPSTPACESCECDLTGKHVVEGILGWFCESCAPAEEAAFIDAAIGCSSEDGAERLHFRCD
jgi:hypothetical protein